MGCISQIYTRNKYIEELKTNLGFQAGSTTMTRSAFVSVRPRPPTWDVRRNIGAPIPS